MAARTSLLFSASFLVAVGLGALVIGPTSANAEGEACTTTKFSSKKVERACADGGRDAAKAYMKTMLKTAKAAGQDVSCKTCHTSLKTFDLADGAADKLARIEKL